MTTQVYQNSRTFDPKEYTVHEADFDRLDLPRPMGLSGHLRVRDEAMSLRACLDSCLPFLDELIITYQDSTDETEEILLEYAAKYPEKIRLFWYPLEYGIRYGQEAVIPLGHLAHFYNYGYTKIRYHYYIKIDADQIYFTEKMCQIRETLCSHAKQKKVWETLPKWYYKLLKSFHKKKASLIKLFSHGQNENSIANIIQQGLQSHKAAFFVLGGINISFTKNTFQALPAGFPFNGCVGDTSIFAPSSADRYFMHKDIYEVFRSRHSRIVLPLGFAWIHTGIVKHKKFEDNATPCSLEEVAKLPWPTVHSFFIQNTSEKNMEQKHFQMYLHFGTNFWEKDMHKYFTPVFYNTHFPQILDYVRQNYHNSISYTDKLRGITKK